MSCIFSIAGEYFDSDAFVAKSGLIPEKIAYKGAPRFKTKPNREKMPYSLITIIASHADFDDFNGQVKETIQFLEANYDKLKLIAATEGIDHANLDFGVDYMYRFMQTHYFPAELLKLCGELGLSIEISVYTSASDEEEPVAAE